MNHQDMPQKPTIPHSRPTLGVEESEAVSEVIKSGHIAEGDIVRRFEGALADRVGIEYAAATNSGTSALHLALLAMEVGPGDEVIIPSYVCSALLNAVTYTGAAAVPAEIEPDTFNLDAADVHRRINRRTAAIIVPHLFGLAADMDPLLDLGVPVVEDCAQAIGATYHRRPVGSFGPAAVYSFYATKMITTAEGGMVTARTGEIDKRIRDLKTYDQREDYGVRYNYKMTDIQAAMGIVQLGRLDSIIRRRKRIASTYNRAFRELNLKLPVEADGHIFFRYVIGLEMDASPWIQALAQMGVGCARPVYRPLHHHLNLAGYPITDEVWSRSLSIPIYPTLTDVEVSRVIDAVTACHSRFN
jgi:dTDP-4-amino-4,6-dideoxygalactose transaminase